MAPPDIGPAATAPGCRQHLHPTGAADPRPGAPALRSAVRFGATESIEVWYDSELGARGRTIAATVLSRGGQDLTSISGFFAGTLPAGPPVRVVLMRTAESSRAYHDRCTPTEVYCDVETIPTIEPRYTSFLLATQLTELVAEVHGQGWQATSAHGEALSRVIATTIYPRRLQGFATAASWLRSAREDFVNVAVRGDDDDNAIGCAALFLHYLHTDLDFSWTQIIAAGAPTLAVTYRRLTGLVVDPFPEFADRLARIFPSGHPVAFAGDNPFPLPNPAGDAPAPPVSLESVPAPGGAGPATVDADASTDQLSRQGEATVGLIDAIAHRRWWLCDTPFRHLRVDDVFTADVHTALEQDFVSRLDRGDFTRSLPGYDASALGLTPATAGAFSVFLTREWHDLIAGIFGIQATGDVIATLHHHAPGSLSGTPHNDLNPGWFPAEPPIVGGAVRVHDPGDCNYRTGSSPSGLATVEHVRAVSLIYYLATPTDVRGGETGFYRSPYQAVASPDVRVAPRNNSLVAFECTPYSFHSFMTNHGQPRNCIAMWLHRSKDEVLRRWGAGSIVGWKQS
jgi:2OG-Fe(II) oxygenase superfamily